MPIVTDKAMTRNTTGMKAIPSLILILFSATSLFSCIKLRNFKRKNIKKQMTQGNVSISTSVRKFHFREVFGNALAPVRFLTPFPKPFPSGKWRCFLEKLKFVKI